MAQPGSCQPWPRTWPWHWDIAVALDSPAQPRLSYLVASTGAGLVLAGTGGAGAILFVSGSLVGSILAGARSSGERRQEQGWGWDRYCQTRVGQEALPAGDMPWPRGPVPGSSPSFPLLQPRTHPGGSLSSPSLSFAVVAAAEEQRGLEKDPCYSLSPPHISPTSAPHQPHCGWRFLCVWWSRRLQSSPERQHCGTGRMSSRHHPRHSSIPVPLNPGVTPQGQAHWHGGIQNIRPRACAHGPPCSHGRPLCPHSWPRCHCGG